MADSMTWADVPVVNPDDIQTGRNVYIELEEKNGVTMTKASAGKIISCIKEGFMPVLKVADKFDAETSFIFSFLKFISTEGSPVVYKLQNNVVTVYSDPSGDLSKPFTSISSDDSDTFEQS